MKAVLWNIKNSAIHATNKTNNQIQDKIWLERIIITETITNEWHQQMHTYNITACDYLTHNRLILIFVNWQ